MENQTIKTITVNNDGTPKISYYNGSWNVIEHTSTDGKDYSITLWETYYAGWEMMYPEVEELTDEQYAEVWEMALDCFEAKLIK